MTAESNTLPDKNDKLERMWVSGFPINELNQARMGVDGIPSQDGVGDVSFP